MKSQIAMISMRPIFVVRAMITPDPVLAIQRFLLRLRRDLDAAAS
jgi:hypothetical protein